MYVPSLVTWWRLRSLILFSTLSTHSLSLSLSPPALPQPDFLLYRLLARGIKPRVLSTSLSYPLFLPSFLLVLSSLFTLLLLLLLLLCKEQRDTQKTSTRSEPTLLLDFHSVDRSFAHNGYRVTRSWRSPARFLFSFYLRNPLSSSSLSRRVGPHGGLRFVPFIGY